MNKLMAACIALVLIPTVASAQRRFELFDIPVAQVSSTEFEVIDADFAGPVHLWCAAAKYAQRALGVQRGRLWVSRAQAPSERAPGFDSVFFSVEPVPNESRSLRFDVRTTGVVKSFAAAISVCDNSEFVVRIRSLR